jgi:spore coat protein H
MRKILRILFVIVACIFLTIVSLNGLSSPQQASGASDKTIQNKLDKVSPGSMVTSANGVQKVITDINSVPLEDNKAIYADDVDGSEVVMYITVRRGNDLENTNHSWAEVSSATKFFFENMKHVTVPKTEVILQIGNETGPLPGELGYSDQLTNATISVRGSSTSMYKQKSYKIELFDSAGEWRGQKTINLNKHIGDITRVTNKLSFDLMEQIPNMTSLRTQFVHLYVKDETADPPSQAFVDYGLFTQIEQPNKAFLKSHLLDRYGQLYKAINCEFYRYPDNIRKADDPLYSEEAFSAVFEIKGNKDHTKLINMLDDVNNWAIPIQQTFDKYFNEDNYFTWMAFNILVGNADTEAQNFFLYSPQNGQKFYFLLWDYDGTFRVYGHYGISMMWGSILHKRVLMVPDYRAKLDKKMNDMVSYLTPERINSMLNTYRPIAEKYVSQMPDLEHLPGTLQQFDQAYSQLPDFPRSNYKMYKEDLLTPMPFFLGTPKIEAAQMRFNWDEAYDFQADDISYKFEVSKDWDFKTQVADITITNINYVQIPKLESGTYFWRVVATNERGKTQTPYDYYVDSLSIPHYGMKYMYISPKGEVIEKQREP